MQQLFLTLPYMHPISHTLYPISQVTVIPYAFASVFRQLEAVRALEERTGEKLKHYQMKLCLFSLRLRGRPDI